MDVKAVQRLAKERFDLRRVQLKPSRPDPSLDEASQERVINRLDEIRTKADYLLKHGSPQEQRAFLRSGSGGARKRLNFAQKMLVSIAPGWVRKKLLRELTTNAGSAKELARADLQDDQARVDQDDGNEPKRERKAELQQREKETDLELRSLIRPELDAQAGRPWVQRLLQRYRATSIDDNREVQRILEDIMVVRVAMGFTADEHTLPATDDITSPGIKHLALDLHESLSTLDKVALVNEPNTALTAAVGATVASNDSLA